MTPLGPTISGGSGPSLDSPSCGRNAHASQHHFGLTSEGAAPSTGRSTASWFGDVVCMAARLVQQGTESERGPAHACGQHPVEVGQTRIKRGGRGVAVQEVPEKEAGEQIASTVGNARPKGRYALGGVRPGDE